MMNIEAQESYTFDDVLLLPGPSSVRPGDVLLSTRLTKRIKLNIPIISAAMDTVTEADLAISLGQEGGLGVVHKNLDIKQQAEEVRRIKRAESGMIVDPITLDIKARVSEARKLAEKHGFSGFPVIEEGILRGMLTNRDFRFEENPDRPVVEIMTPAGKLITASEGTDVEEAFELLKIHRLEKLPLVDKDFKLCGLVTVKDVHKGIVFPYACKDETGRLIAGAAIGVGEHSARRATALVEAGVDVIFIDTAHGHARAVVEKVEELRKLFPDISIVAGNVVTAEATRDLISAGADCIKVGVGPGSICTTRVVAGVGCPQITAIFNCVHEAARRDIPVIADGGVKYSGDIVKALAAGASVVMIGSLFAGTNESPGETVIYKGRKFKTYRGMGSLGAMKDGSADRYFQSIGSGKKLVPEGIEGMVPFKGPVKDYVFQLIGGLRAGMGYIGASTISEMRDKSRFVRVTHAGLRESHTHDVMITKEAPNYSMDSHAF